MDGGDIFIDSDDREYIYIDQQFWIWCYEHYDSLRETLAFDPFVAINKNNGYLIRMSEVEKYRDKIMLKEYLSDIKAAIPTTDGFDFKYDCVDIINRKLHSLDPYEELRLRKTDLTVEDLRGTISGANRRY